MQVELLYTTTEYNSKKPHTEYSIKVCNESLQWMIRKRFSDFVELRNILLHQDRNEIDYIPSNLLPSLPSRLVSYSASMNEATVNHRAENLSQFMTELLSITKDCPNKHVVSFFGAVSTALNEVNNLNTLNGSPLARGLIQVEKYCESAHIGDIILFRCTFPLSILQRSVTGAVWDHIGIVVPDKPEYIPPNVRKMQQQRPTGPMNIANLTKGKRLLEASGQGVTCLPLLPRLRAYFENNCIEYIAVRQLMHTKSNANCSCSRENCASYREEMITNEVDVGDVSIAVESGTFESQQLERNISCETAEHLHTEQSLVEGENEVKDTKLDNEELAPESNNTTNTVADKQQMLQLERGLRWNLFDESEDALVESLSPSIKTSVFSQHREQAILKAIKQINGFVSSVDGSSYGFKLMDLFATKCLPNRSDLDSTQNPSSSSVASYLSGGLTSAYKVFGNLWTTAPLDNGPSHEYSTLPTIVGDDEDERNGRTNTNGKSIDTSSERYFCSALVAHALKSMNVLPETLNPGYFWPGSYASGSLIDEVLHDQGYRYGVEMIVDFNVIAVATSRHADKMPPNSHRNCRVDNRGNAATEVGIALPFSNPEGEFLPGTQDNGNISEVGTMVDEDRDSSVGSLFEEDWT